MLIQVLGLILALGLIFGMVIRRVNLGLALIVGSLVVGVAFGLSAGDLAHVFLFALCDPLTLELSLIIAFIGILAFCMKETGLTLELVKDLKGAISRRNILAIAPALFGLMPLPGGALISAPYVEEGSHTFGVKPETKSSINLWFRHIWMPVSPLEPSLILAAMVTGVYLYGLILIDILVFFILYIFVGYLALIRPLPRDIHPRGKRIKIHRILFDILPILLIISLNILGIPLPIASLIGIGTVFVLRKVGLKKSLSLFRRGVPWSLVLAVIGIMIFRQMIMRTGAFNQVFSSLMGAGIPLVFFLTILPFFFGLTLGLPTAVVGVYFPLIFSVIGANIPLVSILYLSIFFGYLISPIHLCVVLTVDYFKPRYARVYRQLVPLSLLTYAIGVVILYSFLL